jgi:hypothetical protein
LNLTTQGCRSELVKRILDDHNGVEGNQFEIAQTKKYQRKSMKDLNELLQARSIHIDNNKAKVPKIKLIERLVADDKKKLTDKNEFSISSQNMAETTVLSSNNQDDDECSEIDEVINLNKMYRAQPVPSKILNKKWEDICHETHQ